MSLDNSGNIPNMDGMQTHPEPTEHTIREALVTRAEAYAKAAKTSFSAMSLSAVNDSKFLSRVANPQLGFNIKTYQKMVDWLDDAERSLREAAE